MYIQRSLNMHCLRLRKNIARKHSTHTRTCCGSQDFIWWIWNGRNTLHTRIIIRGSIYKYVILCRIHVLHWIFIIFYFIWDNRFFVRIFVKNQKRYLSAHEQVQANHPTIHSQSKHSRISSIRIHDFCASIWAYGWNGNYSTPFFKRKVQNAYISSLCMTIDQPPLNCLYHCIVLDDKFINKASQFPSNLSTRIETILHFWKSSIATPTLTCFQSLRDSQFRFHSDDERLWFSMCALNLVVPHRHITVPRIRIYRCCYSFFFVLFSSRSVRRSKDRTFLRKRF